MTIPTFPTLSGIGWPGVSTPEFSTDIFSAQSGKELRTSNWANPRYHFTLPINFMRNDVGYGQLTTLWNFYIGQKGSLLPFYYTNPADGVTYTCRFEDDTMDFEEFMDMVWEVKQIKFVSIL